MATAVVDGFGWIFGETGPSHGGGKTQLDPIPTQKYRRSERSYQIDIGSDLYSEREMTYLDLYYVLRIMFQFARAYKTSEFNY